MKGLKLEPGWRQACVTWLNLFLLKSKPPTSAWMAPSRGSSATKAPSTSGSCVISQVSLGVLHHADDGAAADLDVGRRLVGQAGLRRAAGRRR